MSWPFDDWSALPLRDGFDAGGAQERTMGAMVGGYSGIRTVEELNPDGSITVLRTRGGNPIFETTGIRRSSQAQKDRGFVAKIPTRAVLFDPYTLDILDANYQPSVNSYSVQDFATNWNVPAADDTDWYDVVLFDGTTIKINAKAMPSLGITANHGYPAIPYVINRETAEDQYGNAERNTTEKRVFAVGRYSVTSWGGSGVTETLTPTAPRSEDRSMTIGQRVDPSTDTAWLGQLYHPSDGWDAAGEWAFTSAEVTMLLTSTYLVKVAGISNVAVSPPSLSNDGASSGSLTRNTSLPPAEVGMYANGNVATSSPCVWGTAGYAGYYSVNYPWSGVVEKPLDGKVVGTYSRSQYSGAISSVETQAGVELSISASNTKIWDSRNESTLVSAQTIVFATHDEYGLSNSNGSDMTTVDDALYWGQHITSPHTPTGLDVGPIPSTRGRPTKTIQYDIAIGGSGVSGRLYEEQTGGFSIETPLSTLVSVSFYRGKSSGSGATFTKATGFYDVYTSNPNTSLGTFSGFGVYSGPVRFQAYTSPATDKTWIKEYYKTGGLGPDHQELIAVDEINEKYSGMQSVFAGMVMFQSEQEYDRSYYFYPFYHASISPSVTLDNSTMSWSSKDYILYDDTNGVYISVEGEFVGVDTTATLTVTLKVQTRHHIVTQTLGEYNYAYAQLVQEREIGSTGKYAMPSPQIRAIFAPLFQEQGSFKGAHYVTLDEESNGATPAHLFNFVLYPEPYSSLGTLNATNDEGQAIHFVPCNLLEMLYAFVFSQEYGVAEDGTRYPVTFTTRYNDMMSTLFSSAFRVSVRDGVQGNWSDSLGADFASISTVSLHRA